MTGNDIVAAASALTEETYDNTTWLSWINACLDDLSQVAYRPGRATISLTAGTYEYDLPSGVQEVTGAVYKTAAGISTPLRQLHPLDMYSEGWKLLDKIVLQNIAVSTGDSLVVNYYRTLAHLTDLTQTPELEAQYHELIVLYCAGRSRQKEEELEERADYYNEYLQRRAYYAEVRRRQVAPWERPAQK